MIMSRNAAIERVELLVIMESRTGDRHAASPDPS